MGVGAYTEMGAYSGEYGINPLSTSLYSCTVVYINPLNAKPVQLCILAP